MERYTFSEIVCIWGSRKMEFGSEIDRTGRIIRADLYRPPLDAATGLGETGSRTEKGNEYARECPLHQVNPRQ